MGSIAMTDVLASHRRSRSPFRARRQYARGKGIGRAMTALPLIEARRQGYRIATLQASSMGRPIYEKMGFAAVRTYQLHMQTA